MRILVTASTFPAGIEDGSRPRFVYDLAEALSAHARVYALAPHHPGAPLRERMGSVEVERFRYWWPASAERLTPNMRQQLRSSLLAKVQVPFFVGAQVRAIRRLVARHGIDVVNAHWVVPQGLSAALVRGRHAPRFRLALHLHAGDVYLLERLPAGRSVARYVAGRSDVLFADGSHVRSTFSGLLGRDCGARLQPMGVHADGFGRPAPSLVREGPAPHGGDFVLFVGRLVEKKGTVHLVRAMPAVRERHPGIRLVLVGSGPEEAALRAEVSRLGLDGLVAFLGHRPHPDVVAHLHRCRVAAVPSIVDRHGETEGMPTVVVEAMAAGVRVVASAVDGIPDVVRHGENGWLCREKDPADLAEKLLLALDDPPESDVVRSAVRTARLYDWAEVARHYMDALARR